MTERTEAPEILVVEDSPVEAELLRRALIRAGYAVSVAKNGEEGLQAARARRPALVMSDINMPLMDGYQLCRAIKYDEELWNVPLILLTALSEPEDIIGAINCGADAYIVKPYVEANLLERIRSLLTSPIRRKRTEERRENMVSYGGQRHAVAGGGEQILNLLLSLYENMLNQNRYLAATQTQLNLLNESLEDQVRGRTAELEQTNRALRILFACNVALVHARSEEELFQTVCRQIVEIGGYLLAWVEYPGAAEGDSPRVGAWFGDAAAWRCHAEMATTPEHADHCLAAIALRTRETRVCNNLHEMPECAFGLLREAGVAAILALPLLHNGEIHGVLITFASVADAFGAAEVELAEELAGDLAYGIVTLRIRAELDRHREHLEELVEQRTAQLAEARQRAEAANEAKSAFLANMSHEIRTPMNAIIGLTHLMKRAGATPEQIERLGKIDGAGHHLLSIINDILDLSKIEAGRLQLESTDFHLSAILDNVRSLVGEQARAK
ncbi:MAG: response regulator, partial [Sulfurisoma sp.]|nr:response regulator [Sulfurisoma sp.]